MFLLAPYFLLYRLCRLFVYMGGGATAVGRRTVGVSTHDYPLPEVSFASGAFEFGGELPRRPPVAAGEQEACLRGFDFNL